MKSNLLRRAVAGLAGLAAALTASAYDLIRNNDGGLITWDDGAIPVVIRMDNTTPQQDGSTYAGSIIAAMNAWNDALTRVQFHATIAAPGLASDFDGVNEVAFDSKIYSNSTDPNNPPTDFGTNVLAVTISYKSASPRGDGTYRRTQSDILFNTAWNWNSYRGALQQPEDIRRVAIHELGHVLGLAHPDQDGQTVTAIMNSTVSSVDSLQEDDLTGAQFQYGRPGGFSPPANNDFANATFVTLTNNSATVTGTSVGANKEGGEPNHVSGEAGGSSVWWKWTATASGTLTVNTSGSRFDTMLAAYTGASVGSLTQLASNDDITAGVVRTSSINFAVTAGTTYAIAVDGWDGEWGAIRLTFSLAAQMPPQFTSHPQNLTSQEGGYASFGVSVSGASSGVSYQWQRLPVGTTEWVNLTWSGPYSNTTGTGLGVSGVTMAMNGDQFRCVATNAGGSAVSNAATLTVTPGPPRIVTQPTDIEIAAGQNVTFTVGATGTGPLNYQWYTSSSAISGANAASYTVVQPTSSTNYQYYFVVVSNAIGSVTSNRVRVTVVDSAPSISTQPSSVTVQAGSNFNLSVSASGGGRLRYQWYRNAVAIPGETVSYLSVSQASLSQTGDYFVTVSNAAGTATSAVARVEVIPAQPPSVVISSDYGLMRLGAMLTLRDSSNLNYGSSATYQWYRDGVALPGATASSLHVNSAGSNDFGSYFLTVTTSAGTGVSNVVTPVYRPLSRSEQPALWSRTREHNGVVYFLFPDTPRIARYDLASESWLSTWTLPAAPQDFEVTSDGVFVAYADRVTRYSPAFTDPVDLLVQTAEEREMLVRPGQLLVTSRTDYYSWSYHVFNPATGQVLVAQAPSFSGSAGIVYSPALRRVLGVVTSYSPRDVMRADWRDDGVLTGFADSPFHGNPEPGTRVFPLRGGLVVAEHLGVVYSSVDLKRVGALGGAFDDLIELPDGRVLLARAGSLVALDAQFNQTGSSRYSANVVKIAVKGTDVVGFAPPAAAGGLPQVVKQPISAAVDSSLATVRDPAGRAMWSPEVRADGLGNLYVFSRLDGNVFRWSAYEGRYTAALPLRGVPNRWEFVAAHGALYHDEGGFRLRRADAASDRPFFTAQRSIGGLYSLGRQLFAFSSPYLVFGARNDLLDDNRSGESSVTFEWSAATRRLYHFRSTSTDDLLLSPISEIGVVGASVDSPYHGDVTTTPPIRVSPDGERVALGSGQVFSGANMTLLGKLSLPVLDLAWTGNQTLHSLRMTGSGAQLTTWKSDFTAERSTTFPGNAVALFAIPGDYLVIVTSSAGVLTFHTVTAADHQTVNLSASSGAPTFLRQPESVAAATADRVAFAVAVRAGSAPTYRWERNGQPLTNGSGISGADTAMLVLDAVTAAAAGTYRVVVTSAGGASATSAEATLTVSTPPPRLTQQPIGAAVGQGRMHTLAVDASDALPLSYQWQRNGTPIDGATGPVLNLTAFGESQVGSYTVVVSNGAQSVTSAAAELTLLPPPVLTGQLQDLAADLGSNASLTIPVPENSNYTFQWFRDGQPLAAANSATLRFSSLNLTDGGAYFVRVSNASGSVTSATVTLTVVTRAPVITQQPADLAVVSGSYATFRIKASGAPTPTYLWQTLTPGATAWVNVATWSDYSVWTNLSMDGTRVRCIATNPYGSVTSNEVVLRVGTSAAAAAIAAGGAHSMVLRSEGYVLVAGANAAGQLGVGASAGWNSFTSNFYSMHAVFAGEATSFLISSYGSVYSSGDNSRGQLGLGGINQVSQPVSSFGYSVSLAPGYRHTLGILHDGTLWAAGANDQGQLGDGTRTDRSSPTRIAAEASAIAAGFAHSFFIKPDATLWAMGANSDGQFGDGSTASGSIVPVQVGTDMAAVSTYHHALFLRRNGTLWASGRNDRGQLGNNSTSAVRTAVQVASDVVAISAGALHSVFLKSDGTVWAMGANDRGQLGDGTRVDRPMPVAVASDVLAIAAGHYHTLILKTDGSVWSVGANESGQLGDGTRVDRATWALVVPAGLSLTPYVFENPTAGTGEGKNFNRLSWPWPRGASHFEVWRATTDDFSSATRIATRLLVPQFTDYSALPNTTYYYWVRALNAGASVPLGGSVTARHDGTVPRSPVITTQPSSLTVGERGTATFTVAATGTGTLAYRWQRNGEYIPDARAASYTVSDVSPDTLGSYRVLVIDDVGQTLSAEATLTSAPSVTTIDSPASSHDALPRLFTVEVASNGGWLTSESLDWATVHPERGLGNGPATIILDSNLSAAPRTGTITIGGHAHVVTQAGSPAAVRKLWLTGSDRRGQLGQGRLFERDELAFAFAGASRVVSTPSATYFLRPDGTLWFTGIDLRASPAASPRLTLATDVPTLLTSGVTRVSASENHLLVLKSDGTLWAAGNAYNGEAGTFRFDPSRTLRQVATGVREIAAGGYHSLLLKTDGTVWATGSNSSGQLGAGNTTDRDQVVQVATDVTAVAAGLSHSAILKSDGSLWTVGANGSGQLGTSDLNSRNSWVQVATDVVEIAAGRLHTLYRKRDGSVWGMGYNAYRALGDVNEFNISTPRQISSLNATAIAAGPNSSYLLAADGRLWGWGWGPRVSSGVPAVIASDVVQVSGGGVLAVVRTDGSVWTAGGNLAGQLGARTALRRLVPMAVAEDVTQVSLGEEFGVWLDAAGTAWGAGFSRYNQLGLGKDAVTSPLRIMDGVASLSAGMSHTLFVKNDGTLWGTGTNQQGELGLSHSGNAGLTPLATGVGRAFAGSSLSFYTVGDALWGMGRNDSGELGTGASAARVAPTSVFSRALKVLSLNSGSVVLRTDGTVWVSGYGVGRFGSAVSTSTQFVQIEAEARDIALGSAHLLVLKRDGTVLGFGYNTDRQLAPNGATTSLRYGSPVTSGAVALAANASSTFILKSGGELFVAGYNAEGQLGNGRSDTPMTLDRIGTSVLAVAAGANHSGFIAPDGFLTVPLPPSLVVPPQPQAAVLGGTATFSVVATGEGPLTYQWQRNDVDLPGATSASLTIDSVQSSDIGFYSVVVSNALGSATSPLVALDVALPPTVVTQPQGGTYYTGMTATLSVAATGGGLSYQWSRDDTPIEGATSATLELAALQSGQAGTYRVRVSNSAGFVVSSPAVLTVLPGAAPAIVAQPTSVTTGLGGRVLFSVVATGAPTPSYRWQRQAFGSDTWEDINNANSLGFADYNTATLLVQATAIDTISGHRFRVIVSNPLGSVTSEAATLTISGYVAPTSISGGYKTAIITAADGYAFAMGANYTGQFGDGSLNSSSSPVRLVGQAGVTGAVAGFEHTLYVKLDGSIWATGFNDSGQLANGSRGTSGSPVRITHAAVGGAAGYRHTLFHLNDGRLFAAGWNAAGQLGDGTTSSPEYSVKVADDVVRASAGFNHSLFLKGDGTVWAMGGNGGVYGNGTTESSLLPVQVGSGVRDVSTSFFHTVFLKTDGTVWTTGQNDQGQLGDGTLSGRSMALQVATGVVEIAAGYKHTALLKTDGTVWTFGDNDLGQLGDGSTLDKALPVQVATDVVSIATGFYTTMILKKDGSVWATGGNDAGQLGDGTTTNRSSFVRILGGQPSLPNSNPEHGATYNPAAAYIALNWLPVIGTTYYRVWRNTEDNRANAVLVGDRVRGSYFRDPTALSGVAYRYWVEAVNPFGTVSSSRSTLGLFGSAAAKPTITGQPQNVSVAVGGSATFSVEVGGVGPFTYQWLKDGVELEGRTSSSLVFDRVVAEDAGNYAVRVTNAAGEVISTAATLSVTFIAPTIVNHPVGATVSQGSAVTFTVSAVGSAPFSYQWTKDGTDIEGATASTLTLDAVTASDGGAYRVRVSNAANSVLSNPAVLVVAPPPPAIVQAAVAHAHAGFVRADGKLFMMGDNSHGQLGDGTVINRRTPVEIDSGVIGVATGLNHTVFVKQDGTLWGMGSDSSSQMGGRGAQSSPVQLASDVIAVKAHSNATVFLKRDGTLWGMGENTWFMFGAGPTYVPTPRQLGTRVVDFSVGPMQVAYVRSDGTAWGCGFNRGGQLGIEDGDRTVFTLITTGASRIRVSGGASFIVKSDGSLLAMGRNFNGQLGDGTMTDRLTPVTVAPSGIVDAVSGSSSYNLSFWLRDDGTLLAVGHDSSLGATLQAPAPIATGVASMALANVLLWTKTDGSLAGFGYNDDGELGLGDAMSVQLPGQTIMQGQHVAPLVPAGLSVTAGALEGAVRLQWTPVLGATSYEIWRGTTDSPAAATRIATRVGASVFFDVPTDTTSRFYHVRAVNPAGTSAASAVLPGFVGEAPTIVSAPVARAVTHGDRVTFAVTAAGTAPLTYQWRRNDEPITDATASTLTLDPASVGDAGLYSVTVSNALGSVTSAPVILSVAKLDQTITFARPPDRPFTTEPFTVTATASSGLPVTISVYYGPATMNGNTVTLHGAGQVALRATQPGNTIYNAAPVVERVFMVTENLASWTRFHFSEAERADPVISGPQADPDHDGLGNLLEYALGLSPRVIDDTPGVMAATETEWVFTYTCPPARPDVTLTVQTSTNLTTWNDSGFSHTRVSTAPDGTETWRAVVVRSASPVFFRLAATK